MNDQSFLQAVSNTNQTPTSQSVAVPVPAKAGQIRKRFRRKATHQSSNAEIVNSRDGSALGFPKRAGQFEITAPRPDKVRPMRPVRPSLDAWDVLPLVPAGGRKNFLSGASIINTIRNGFRQDQGARAFDLLRTRLLQTLRANGWNRIAIAAPTHGCGSTFTAVNLAQSLARVPGSRTVLMDINHRSPGVAAMLGIDKTGDMREFLGGEVPIENHLVRASQTLALGLAAQPEDSAAEILHNAACAKTLDRMVAALRPDVVLYDLPPVLEYDDMAAFLPQVDGVLLVSDGTKTMASQIAACEKILDGQTQLLGIILNRARDSGGE